MATATAPTNRGAHDDAERNQNPKLPGNVHALPGPTMDGSGTEQAQTHTPPTLPTTHVRTR